MSAVRWSLRARLTAWYSGIVVMVVVATAVVVGIVQERLSLKRLDEEIARQMLTLQGVMHTEFGKGLSLEAAAEEASTEVVAPGLLLVLLRADGSTLAMWGPDMTTTWRPPIDADARFRTVTIDADRGRLLSERVNDEGRRYVAAVVAPLGDLERDLQQLQRSLVIGVLSALALAAIAGLVVGRQALRPLSDLARQARSISETNPVERLKAPNPQDELGTFASAFNGLLDRLASALHAQRQFMADASHELRTPVSIVRSAAQITLSREQRTDAEYRESLTIVGEQAERLTRLVDAMFLLSRAEANGLPLSREAVYLDDLVAETVRGLLVVGRERHVMVESDGDHELLFVGDDRLLRQMLTNLLDNAIRHARRRVVATCLRTPTSLIVRVTDDGPGIDPVDQQRIFQRFVRLKSDYAGAGLGLPIAKWIAQAHGGELTLESSGPSGTAFVVTLPALADGGQPAKSSLDSVPAA
ncbi:MAG TPA: HAMP domain-containing sensor histidine kinase [Vicinamibacterales bacterium]|nr:HAMP domain-containing sensor histidine kinase [Vicinamibacterales bacterium]